MGCLLYCLAYSCEGGGEWPPGKGNIVFGPPHYSRPLPLRRRVARGGALRVVPHSRRSGKLTDSTHNFSSVVARQVDRPLPVPSGDQYRIPLEDI